MDLKSIHEHDLFDCEDKSIVEVCYIGATQCLIETTFATGPNKGNTVMQPVDNVYIDTALRKGSLVPHKATHWIIQRKLDDKYYLGGGLWTEDETKAAKFSNEIVDASLKILNDRLYDAVKIAM